MSMRGALRSHGRSAESAHWGDGPAKPRKVGINMKFLTKQVMGLAVAAAMALSPAVASAASISYDYW
jgi:hypothetical protein